MNGKVGGFKSFLKFHFLGTRMYLFAIKLYFLMSFTIHLQVKSCTLYITTYDQKYKRMIE